MCPLRGNNAFGNVLNACFLQNNQPKILGVNNSFDSFLFGLYNITKTHRLFYIYVITCFKLVYFICSCNIKHKIFSGIANFKNL